MKKTLKITILKGLMVLVILFVWSCEKFVVVDPPITSLTGNTVFTDEATATAAILNIYQDISRAGDRPFQGELSLAWMSGLMADEFTSYFNDNRAEFAAHQITPQNMIVRSNWAALYEDIYRANIIIEQIGSSDNLSRSFRDNLEGEARFVRALMYFYLVNFWENVPLVLTTDYIQNRTLPQSTKEAVYAQIIEDLTVAQELFGKQAPPNRRTRPNYFTTTSLLSNVYLHTQQWEKAIEAASASIGSGLYDLEEDLNHAFLSSSKEVIWHIEPVVPFIYTWDGFRFILRAVPTAVTTSDSLLESFDREDIRGTNWIGVFNINGNTYHFPHKYKVKLTSEQTGSPPEFLVMFRLAEQYLIRAESKVRLGDLAGAATDLNKVRNRAGLASVESSDVEALLEMILKERRLELFTEGCNRWFDLKRLGIAKTTVLPIPENELLYNPALVQNLGY